MNHTPGSWQIEMGSDYAIYALGGAVIFRIEKGTIPMRDDARLIAAAPELLAALRQIAWLEAGDQLGSGDVAAIRAAIAKAEGQQ